MRYLRWLTPLITLVLMAGLAAAQAPAGGPAGANNPAEARALGYLRTVFTAQFSYKKKHKEYARSLAALVGQGSFTRRMASSERGEYTARFSGNGAGFSLGMVPKAFDADHRAFFVNETGTVRVEADKPANGQSPALK